MIEQPVVLFFIDDEDIILTNFLAFFEDFSEYEVHGFPSAEDALGQLVSLRPAVCLVDMRLPGISGQEYVVQAKKLLPECFFLIHTGSVGQPLSPELVGAGLTEKDIFHKPCNMDLLHSRICELVGSKGAV